MATIRPHMHTYSSSVDAPLISHMKDLFPSLYFPPLHSASLQPPPSPPLYPSPALPALMLAPATGPVTPDPPPLGDYYRLLSSRFGLHMYYH